MGIQNPAHYAEKSMSTGDARLTFPSNRFFVAMLGIGLLVGITPLALDAPLWTIFVAPFLAAPYLWLRLRGLHDQAKEELGREVAQSTAAEPAPEHAAEPAPEHAAEAVSVGADDPRLGEAVEMAVAERRPLTIVFDDGIEIAAEPAGAHARQEQLPDVIQSRHRQMVIDKLPADYRARVFPHPTRIRLMESLKGRQASYLELSKELDISPSEASYHLRQLEKAGIVEVAVARPEHGAMVRYYRASDPSRSP